MICVTLFNIASNIMVVVICTIIEAAKWIKRAKWCKKKEEQVVGIKPINNKINESINLVEANFNSS